MVELFLTFCLISLLNTFIIFRKLRKFAQIEKVINQLALNFKLLLHKRENRASPTLRQQAFTSSSLEFFFKSTNQLSNF